MSVATLKKAKALISAPKWWSPDGSGKIIGYSDERTYCVLSALDNVLFKSTLTSKAKIETYSFVRDACNGLFGTPFASQINDGKNNPDFPNAVNMDDKTDFDRFKMVHQILDEAIKMAEAAEVKQNGRF